jgi:hypothetical protein
MLGRKNFLTPFFCPEKISVLKKISPLAKNFWKKIKFEQGEYKKKK